jgi:hypothetical protein
VLHQSPDDLEKPRESACTIEAHALRGADYASGVNPSRAKA